MNPWDAAARSLTEPTVFGPPWTWPVILALLAAVVLVEIHRRRGRRVADALPRRVSVQMQPTTDFDPDPSEVVRYAWHLSRARLAAGDTPDAGAAVRLHFTADGDGQLVMRVHGPEKAAAVLDLSGYGQVEAHRLDTGRPAGNAYGKGKRL
ncbi:hypothetical protein G5C51_04635 [Streptomyces sp. A7024]|uniref:Uncharacterized protein n=1 Tax=Streptomyces coryli TaxID=1128680 RepID=A0A6G4TT83_9ACTN|nr:hypothetical protein [Streptomyces coryli]NGN63195.1 hypothetical protein [Streptomyces coryli]